MEFLRLPGGGAGGDGAQRKCKVISSIFGVVSETHCIFTRPFISDVAPQTWQRGWIVGASRLFSLAQKTENG